MFGTKSVFNRIKISHWYFCSFKRFLVVSIQDTNPQNYQLYLIAIMHTYVFAKLARV